MALKKKTRTLLLVFGIPVVLVVGLAIGLKLYFTEQRLKDLIVPALAGGTNREVGLERISLSLFPGFGVEMRGLVIKNKQGDGFSDRPYVSLDGLTVRVKIMPLLRGSLEVTEMILDKPDILLEVNKEGRANYSDEPAGKTGHEATEKTSGGEAGAALFSNIRIREGRLQYVNHKSNSSMEFEGLDMTLRGEIVPAASEMRFTTMSTAESFSYGTTASSLISGLRLALDQDLVYNQRTDILTLSNGRARVQNIEMAVNGSIADLTKRFMMDIRLESETVNIADLMSLVPGEYQKNAGSIKGTGVARIKLAVTGTVDDTTVADVAGSVLTTGASIQYAGLPKAITNVTIVADFERSAKKQEFNISKFSALLGNNPVRATMKLVNFEDPLLTLAAFVDIALSEVRDYYPLEAGTELSGALKTEVNIAGKINNPQALRSSGTMDFRNVTIKTSGSGRPLENLNGTVTFNNQILESQRLSMTLGRSDLALGFRLRNYLSVTSDDPKAPKASANLTLNSRYLSTADLLGEKTSATKPGAPPQQGSARGGLPLPNVEMDVNATIGKLEMERMTLENVRGTLKLLNGVLSMQSFTCNTFGGSVTSKGTVNLQEPARPMFDLALDMNGMEAGPLLGTFTSFGQRVSGKLSMSTTLKGALDDTLGLVPQALSGAGNVRMEAGRLQGVKANAELASMLKLPDLEVINFREWMNSFTISDGKFLIKDLRISALGADYVVNGAYGLDGVLDYGMSVLLSEATSARVTIPGFGGEAVGLFKDESGRVKLDFRVTGTAETPKLAFDTSIAQRRAEELARQKLDAEKRKLEDELKKKGGDLLKKVLPGGK